MAHSATRRTSRYRKVATILARHGLGYLVHAGGLDRFVPFHHRLLGHAARAEPHTGPEHLRSAVEELGATAIKLGQILSTRADLLPEPYLVELARLQDQVPPVPLPEIRDVLVAELGRPPEELFATFDPEPLAAASIGQVHAATLVDGSEVVVKVRRPGIVEQIEEDLDILQNLAAVASRRWELAEEYDLLGLAQEFAQTLRAELDYLREGRSAERFAANIAGDPRIHIPRVHWETTTSRILTLERIRGTKINDIAALEAAAIDRAQLARQAADLVLEMIFEHGFFHADPHPGNFFVEPDGRIGLIDFGMVGAVDERTQEQLVDLLLAISSQDPERMVDTFVQLGIAGRRINREALHRDLEHLLSRYYGQPLGEIVLRSVLEEVLGVVRRHRLRLPPNLALLFKTLSMNEAIGAQLDPSFRLTSAVVPYAQRLLLRQYSPTLWARRLGRSSLEALRLGTELPEQLRRLIGEVERGGLEVGMRPEHFEPLVGRFERLANRIVLGIISAAFIVGLSVLLSVYRPPGWDEWAGAVFAMGFLIAVALGTYLAWSILRTGR